jgi:endonuclease YncB( thermonuclease family)
MMVIKRSSLVLILTLVLTGSSCAVGTEVSRLVVPGSDAAVLDGDTIVLEGQRIRLFGIDAPESKQRCDTSGRNWDCGAWSTKTLRDLVQAGPVSCRQMDWDQIYNRAVSVCKARGQDLSAALVRAGAAIAYVKYTNRYQSQEAAAKSERLGLWSGQHLDPSDFRRNMRQVSQPSATCAIKGNIGATGVRIYHLPGQRDYASTKISTQRGEAYFCTQAEAEAAGFRIARR